MNIVNRMQKGFTLIEIAIVLAILGILFGAGFTGLGAYMDNANQAHTMGNLKVTKRALLDFVMVNKYMPCPDTDTPADGKENRAADQSCSGSVGTVPFDDIGLGAAVTSDDWGNLFGYGVNTNVVNVADIGDSTDSASYFGNQSPPVFTLQTPPTTDNPLVPESYTVCKKDTNACDAATASHVEVSAIPAVIVAFNENGSATSLLGCNGGDRGVRETENCNADLLLWKGRFDNDEYDDQMVTISGYEIKQQITWGDYSLGPPPPSEYEDYEVIIRRDVDSANDLNVGTGEDNSFYIDTNDAGEGGNLNANVQLKDGDDRLKIVGNIKADGNADMGADNDELIVLGSILLRGQATLGDGDDTSIIGGGVNGEIDAGFGGDTVIIKGDVTSTGQVLMNKDDDDLYLYGDLVGGTLDGGTGTDTLHTPKTAAEWAQMLTDFGGTVTGFENMDYEYVIPSE
ncbi:type II secretion system protein [Thiomicrorhabdus sp. zzn3]|uniref:type II secretion system protein n=1 Tax=Thiomicrorhabdus sp. zzn3 TaxID=3039775 RepID=UPI002436E369|nr:type II secretion system protein [Thiomicrorhabdus sp. zzn3]MDG6779110.1 type II secretion system protein [Thiomicrorhabdus sp. zzn3]